ncbi:CaiB/BaiF CoA-transferase family protein [Novosphingobium sp.]|uniref:CaiB/BaiF CoA transferase family protein n=1 Tax=Novosphingobium sp. TaxID=1874826 RepID=UPI0028ADC381|nr:CaiB/BaiF CoA-transferase family protein [Novosphingobium sp.]
MTARLPLAGLTVVAVEQAVAAPFCTSRLADAGARVIKIERPEGDFARGYDDAVQGSQSSYFVWLNRGKESHVVDLARPEGKAELAKLIEGADVLVQNLKPGALARLGFDPEKLRVTHPRLVICSISGYGDGPMADRKAYDLLIQAESGLSSVTGGPEAPARVGISIVDIATGATAHAAVLEALIGRGITGEGADIRVSMFDVMADWLTVPLLQEEGGKPPRRMGLAHPSIAPYGVFTTRDRQQVLLSIQSDREWAKFAAVFLGDAAYGSDPHFATNVQRVCNRAQTDALVADAFAFMTKDEACDRLLAADAAFASVNDMAGLSRHEQLRRITVETGGGTVSYPAPAAIFRGEERRYGPVPRLGEDDIKEAAA